MAKNYKFAIKYSLSSLFLMLLGWIDDLGGFFLSPWRTWTLIIQVSCFFWMGLYLKYGLEEENKEKAELQFIVTSLSFIGPGIIQFLGPLSERLLELRIANLLILNVDNLRIAGMFFFIFSFIPMIWGPIHQGRFFSLDIEIKKDHKLVTDGPFRVVRHPKYFGMLFYYIGFALIFRSVILIIIIFLALIFILWRIRDEEVLLSGEFGEKWQSYCRKTKWRLVPFIW